MIKKLLELIMGNEEVMKDVSVEEIEASLELVKKKKIEYLTFKSVKVSETKNADGSLRIIAIASTDSVDRGSDVVVQSGIKTTNIKNNKIPMLLQHNYDALLGSWDKWRQEENKFIVEGTFATPVTDWQKDAFEKVKSGDLNGISIGFIIEKVSFQDDIRYLDEIELIEVSIVTIPMNQDAYITSVEEVKNQENQQENEENVQEDVEKDLKNFNNINKSEAKDSTNPAAEDQVSPDTNKDEQNPAVEESVNTSETEALKTENDSLKARVAQLEAEIADYEATIAEATEQVEALLKSKGYKNEK